MYLMLSYMIKDNEQYNLTHDHLFRDPLIGFSRVVDIFGVLRVFGFLLCRQIVFIEHR